MPTDPPTPPSSPDGAATVRIRRPHERRDAAGWRARTSCAAILADPEARVWVDVTSSSPSDILPVAELLDLHPLIADDIAERNQRAKVAEVEGMIHVVLFWIAYQGEVDGGRGRPRARQPRAARRSTSPAGTRTRCPQLRGDPGNAPQARPGLPPVRDHRRHRRRLLPGHRRARRRDRRAPGRRHRRTRRRGRSSGCSRSSAS